MRRRTFLGVALASVAGVPLSACGGSSPPQAGGGRILLAYFSRPGENYWNGGRRDLEVGNTEVLARTIIARLDCDVHRIEAADPYPATTTRPSRATSASRTRTPARRSRTRSTSTAGYDTVLLASPIWNVRPPMIMTTFTERYDLSGKTLHPVTTRRHERPRRAPEDYARVVQGAPLGDRASPSAARRPLVAPRLDAGCAAPASRRHY